MRHSPTTPSHRIGGWCYAEAAANWSAAAVTPDSGPMHIANAMGTKVLGLHAASNPNRSGPYSDRRYCVDRYDDAARKYRGKPASELKWGTKIEAEGVMDLITVDDAIAAFERYRNHIA